MTISPGVRLGPYEIVAALGAGGMGEVFLARDTRLDRSVAIKILPPGLASDAESRQRFEVEARAVSSLNHPNICTLFDVGRHEDVDFFVMELLEGQSLAQRLVRGALLFDQALRTAVEIASALDAAHRHGVVHRDLKPSNVMLTKSGAKLLDFGLAKVNRPVDVTGRSTLTVDPALTAKGAILGTFQYMAPEQLEGKDVDARADIFAFGAMLYEMATGRKAFEGQSQASLTAAILERDPPPPSALKAAIPPAFDHVVTRCLAKNPDERWHSARDVLFELTWIASGAADATAARRSLQSRTLLPWSLAAAAALAGIGAIALYLWQAPAIVAPVQLEMALPEGTISPNLEIKTTVAMSPDGRHLAFTVMQDGRLQVWLRSLESLVARPLPGTEGAQLVFWSPDSQALGFVALGKLQRIGLSGGSPQLICEGQVETVPTWGHGNTILFDQNAAGARGIFRVSANGGPVTQVTSVDRARHEREHFWPSFLPDGVHFFYLASVFRPETSAFTHTVHMASLDAPGATRVADVDSRMTYAAPGHVLYAQDGALLARRFDLVRRQLEGDPVRVAERPYTYKLTGLAEFSASDNGILAFRTRTGISELVWFDRTGKRLETVGAPAAFGNVRISPDGGRIAVDVIDPRSGTSNLWIYDRTGIPTAFSSDPTEALRPSWSSDGLRLIFRSSRDGPPDIYQKRADGRGTKELVFEANGVQSPDDASSDGRHVAYTDFHRTTLMDLWVLPLTDPRKPKPYLVTGAREGTARFSPDGRWLAFVSTETGGPEIYVAPLDEPGAKTRISSAGGVGPRWRRDGKELYYFTLDNTLMAVTLSLGQRATGGVPRPLFSPGPVYRLTAGGILDPGYDVSADGQRFLVNRTIEDASRAPTTVVLNWPALLRKP